MLARRDAISASMMAMRMNRPTWRRWVGALAASALLLVHVVGCGARVAEENSRLRRQVLELEDRVESLEQQVAAKDAQLRAFEEKLEQPKPAVAGVRPSDLPMLAAIDFARYSGAYDTTGDGADDTVRIYLLTEDQRGRFLPIAGKATISVVWIPPDAEPVTLASRPFDPAALRDAYVAGLTGTHYTLELKLPSPLPAAIEDRVEATTKVTVTDAATGVTLTKQLPTLIRATKAAREAE